MEDTTNHESHISPEAAPSSEKYIDLLSERRQSSDLRWAIREWEAYSSYKYGKMMSRQEIFEKVKQSERVKHTVQQLEESGEDPVETIAEVERILEQMAHTLELSVIRQFGFILPKIMKRIYGKVLINEDGVQKLRSTIEETPVLLLPTHRSYADFLLVSYIAFHFNLPLPVIAAGMDFMNMAVIGDMLRGAGAFYIRRSFVDNTLYWAVFQEYVQTLVEGIGSPLEFFLEGTRSRSGKSLPPKLGLLGCVSECWLRGRLPDLAFVPISISYERTLEEKLYAYELLGVPKPPESTSGLLKATSILKESFGDIIVNVGEPVSARTFLCPRVDRHLFASVPSYLAPLSKNELSACEALGHHALRRIQQGAVTSLWSVACLQLMPELWKGHWTVPFTDLAEKVSWMINIMKKIGGNFTTEGSTEEALLYSLSVHEQLACLGEDGDVHIQQVHKPTVLHPSHNRSKNITLSSGCVEQAVTHLMLQYYINQAAHLLIRPALVAQALLSLIGWESVCPVDKLQSRFELLRTLLGFDFIFEKGKEGKDFMEGLSLLTWSGELTFVQGCVHLVGQGGRLMTTLLNFLRPFCITYTCAAQTMGSQEWPDQGALILAIQSLVERLVIDCSVYSALSLDTVRHATRALIKIGAASKNVGIDGQVKLIPDHQKLSTVTEILKRHQFDHALRPKL